MTATQGGEQRLSDSAPTPIIEGSGTTQTPLMEDLLSLATLPATRRPLLVPHKATGGAMTQTRTTNVVPTPPPIQTCIMWTECSTAVLTDPQDLIYLNSQTDYGWTLISVTDFSLRF